MKPDGSEDSVEVEHHSLIYLNICLHCNFFGIVKFLLPVMFIESETFLWPCLSIRRSVGRSDGWSFCHDFVKGPEVSFPCSYRRTCSIWFHPCQSVGRSLGLSFIICLKGGNSLIYFRWHSCTFTRAMRGRQINDFFFQENYFFFEHPIHIMNLPRKVNDADWARRVGETKGKR